MKKTNSTTEVLLFDSSGFSSGLFKNSYLYKINLASLN